MKDMMSLADSVLPAPDLSAEKAALGRSTVDTLFMMNVLLMMMEMKKRVIIILYYHDHDGDNIDDDDDDDEDMLVDDVNESELNNIDYNASSDERFKLMTPRDKQRTASRLQSWNKQGRHNHNIREIKTKTYYIHLHTKVHRDYTVRPGINNPQSREY